jgi:hypothetical protein
MKRETFEAMTREQVIAHTHLVRDRVKSLALERKATYLSLNLLTPHFSEVPEVGGWRELFQQFVRP